MISKEEKRVRFNSQSLEDKALCVNSLGIYLYRVCFNSYIVINVFVIEDELVEVWFNTKLLKAFSIRVPNFDQLDNHLDVIILPEEFYA